MTGTVLDHRLVRDHLDQRWQRWNLLELGPRHGEDGQPRIAARLARVLPEIATWAASFPRVSSRSNHG